MNVVSRGVVLLILMAGMGCAPTVVAPRCAVDMGSNSFRRIVGSFADGRYVETHIESKTLGVGDDVERHGRISDAKLAEIEAVLNGFAAACRKDGAPEPVAIGTAAFRNAPNGARVVEFASRAGVRMEIATEQRHHVFNLGYRIAYEEFFARAADPAAAIAAFRDRLLQEFDKAPFMSGQSRLVGVEFMEMAEVLLMPVGDGHVYSVRELRDRLDAIRANREGFESLKRTKDIDRALPRLVVAVALMERFGYSELSLTSRQLGTGLIIEAGLGASPGRPEPHPR